MARRRHTPEQIIRKLREAEQLQAQGTTIVEAAKQLGISEQTYHVAQPVRRYEGRRRQAAQGAGTRECPAEADRGRPGVGHRRAQGGVPGKILSPARRRAAVAMLQRKFGMSQRRACRVINQPRSTQRYRPDPIDPDVGLAGMAPWVFCRSSAVGLPAGSRLPRGGRLWGEPQEDSTVVARRRTAGTGQAP